MYKLGRGRKKKKIGKYNNRNYELVKCVQKRYSRKFEFYLVMLCRPRSSQRLEDKNIKGRKPGKGSRIVKEGKKEY